MTALQRMLSLVAALMTSTALAGPPETGPIVENFGPVFDVPTGAYNLAADTLYKVRLDVAATGKSPAQCSI